ncbi:hypothetical protein Tco_1466080 [Tanacetum coccineum]
MPPKGNKDQGEVDSSIMTSGVSIPVSTQGEARSDPEKAHEWLCTTQMFHENLKLITDERVIDDNPESHSGSMSSMKNLEDTDNFGDQFLYDKPTEDDQEKSKVIEESDSTIPDPSHQTVTSTPPVIAPFTDVSSTKPSSLVTPPPINTEATTITTSLPEITPFIALQLRVARLEQEMSEVKKTDHSADVLASIKSQVPTVVDKYLGTKLDDALLKILERHTADLIEKYSALPGPESIKNQESEKSPKEIIRIKREQGEEKQDSTYSIRSTDKVALKEFDLKSALFKHMNKNKNANRNPANYHLYHALMEALIADEDAMDKEVAVKVKDHKRKHDSDDEEDDDDDEGPSAGSNQGRSAKRRRPESATSGSAQPPSKDDHQSSKKPRESDASASIQHPALTSTGWQITDTRDDVVNSLMHMLPNNIQITDTSLMHMLNLNPSPHKKDSLVLLSEIPLLCQRRGLLIRLRSSRWEADVVSEHFDRDDNAGDDNEETKPDPEEIYNSGPGPQLLTPRTISSGLVPQPPSPTPNVPPTKNDWDSLFCPMFDEYFNPSPSVVQHVLVAVVQEPVVSTGTPSSMRIDQDTPSTSTSQTTQEEQSHVIPTSVEEDDHGIEVAHMDNDLISVDRYLLQTLGQEKLEFLMKKVRMQSKSPETMKKLADKTEELWCFRNSDEYYHDPEKCEHEGHNITWRKHCHRDDLEMPFKIYPKKSMGVLINSSKSFNDLSVEVEAARVVNHF